MIHFQNSLFPDNKGTFDPEVFVREHINEHVAEWITSSIKSAFSNMLNMCEIQPLTLRAQSDVLHDGAFAQIMQNASLLPGDIKPMFYSDISGNKKQYFEFNGYFYVLRKSGVISNGTRIDKAIQNQELDKHVITIEYTISPLRDSISSISFKYIKGDGTELDYILPTSSSEISSISLPDNSNTDSSTETYTPRFKKSNHKKAL